MINQEIENVKKNFTDETKLKGKRIFVYMGSYAMVKGTAVLTHNSDKTFVYRKYRDIETGETITVNRTAVEVFEKENNIIFTIVDDYTQEEYEKTYKVIREMYEKELSSSNKEEAFKLIKKLTPLK